MKRYHVLAGLSTGTLVWGRCPLLGRSTVRGLAWALPLVRGSLHTLESKGEAEELQKSPAGRAGQHEDAGIATRNGPAGQVGMLSAVITMLLAGTISREHLLDGMQWAGGVCAGHTCSHSPVHSRQRANPTLEGLTSWQLEGLYRTWKVWFGLL